MSTESDNSRARDLFGHEEPATPKDVEDDEESTVVNANLYDRSFDELITEYATIPSDEQANVWWYAIEPSTTTPLIRYMARELEMSFNAISQTALMHGLSIFRNRYAETINLVESLDDSAVVSGNRKYLNLVDGYCIGKPKDTKRIQTRSDKKTSEALGELSAVLRCSKAYIAGTCIMLSLNTSGAIPAPLRKVFLRSIDTFDIQMKIKQQCALGTVGA